MELPPGPPPNHDVEFKVDLVNKAKPVNIAPYKLSPVEREDIWTSEAQWEPLTMPFRVKNGPSVAQRLSNKLFGDMPLFISIWMTS